ncbi:tetratricopeptide repeat protein [Candidatus Bipolaricaulota bacterium]
MSNSDRKIGNVKDLGEDFRKLSTDVLGSIHEIARLRVFAGEFEKALALLDAPIPAVIEDFAEGRAIARHLILKAEVVLYQAVYSSDGHDLAFAPLEEASQIAGTLQDEALLADVLAMRAWILCYRELAIGRPRDAMIEPAQKCLEIRQKLNDSVGTSEALVLLGLANEFKEERDAAKAQELYLKANELSEKHNEKRWRSYATRHIGFYQANEGNLDGALAWFQRSLRLRQEIGFIAFLSPAYYAVGQVQLDRGEIDEAIKYSQEAYDLGTKLGMDRFRFIALLPLGEAYARRGDVERGKQVLNQAKVMASSFGERFVAAVDESIAKVEELTK